MRIISEELKQRRLALGYSSDDIASQLRLKTHEYERYEDATVKKRIDPVIITKLAQILQCSSSDFMDWTSSELPEKKESNIALTLYNGHTYQISNLPKEAQEELEHFMEYLTQKYNAKQ